MKRMTRTAITTLSVVALAALAACSDGAAEAGEGGSSDAKIAVVLKTLTSEFWQEMEQGVKDRADELGIDVDVYASASEDDVEGQVKLVENAIGRGYEAIGVAPISSVNLNNVLADASEQGIYVVNIDEAVDIDNLHGLGGTVQAFITTDNEAVGRMAGEFITEHLGGAGQVAIIEGKAGVESGEQRKAGAMAAFESGGLDLVDSQPADWDRTKAFNLAQNYINKFPDLKAIYAANDTMAMGAQEAVTASGKDIVVVGTDGNSDAVESVKNGELGATVKQDSGRMGADTVDLLNALLTDRPEISVDAEIEQVRVDAQLVTRDS